MSGFVGVEELFIALKRTLGINDNLLRKQRAVLIKALLPLTDMNKYAITLEDLQQCIDRIPHSFYEECQISIENKEKFKKFITNYLLENIKYMIA